jgi:hypothetical protein
VANSVVSREAARDLYGVVLKADLEIDREATQELRRHMAMRHEQDGGVKNEK